MENDQGNPRRHYNTGSGCHRQCGEPGDAWRGRL